MSQQPPIGILICAVIVLVASFMTWGSFPHAESLPSEFNADQLHVGPAYTTATAWTSTVTIAGIDIPNWILVISSAVVAAFAFLRWNSVWSSPLVVDFLLSLSGLIQVLVVLYLFCTKGRVGIGSIITVACFYPLLHVTAKAWFGKIIADTRERQRLMAEQNRARYQRPPR